MVQTKHTKSNPTTFKSKINRNFHKSKWIREIFSINNKKARRPLGDRTGYHTYEMHFVFYVVKFQQHRRVNRMMNGTHDRAFTIPSCAYNSLNPISWVMLFECGEEKGSNLHSVQCHSTDTNRTCLESMSVSHSASTNSAISPSCTSFRACQSKPLSID